MTMVEPPQQPAGARAFRQPPPRLRLLGACVTCWSAIAAPYVVRLRGWTHDDFFITYRYARNLARGLGLVYNAGERVFGTSDPGLALLLALLHRLSGVDVPLLASCACGVATIATGLALVLAADSSWSLASAVLAGTALIGSSYVWSNAGSAAHLATALLAWAALQVGTRQVLAGGLAATAVWARPDALLGVALLLLLVIVERRKIPIRFVVSCASVCAVGLASAFVYYGQILPGTLHAKVVMGAASTGSATHWQFWSRAQLPLERHFGSVPLLPVLGALGAIAAITLGGRVARLLVLNGLGTALGYPLLGVPFSPWYILPSVVALVVGSAHLCGALARSARSKLVAYALPACLFALLSLGWIERAVEHARSGGPAVRQASYVQAATWLREHSPRTATVAYVEIGVLGYFSERTVLDLMGIVTPWVRPYVAANDLLGALQSRPADFVLAHPRGRMNGIVTSRWFAANYERVLGIRERGTAGAAQELTLYRARPASLPVYDR